MESIFDGVAKRVKELQATLEAQGVHDVILVPDVYGQFSLLRELRSRGRAKPGPATLLLSDRLLRLPCKPFCSILGFHSDGVPTGAGIRPPGPVATRRRASSSRRTGATGLRRRVAAPPRRRRGSSSRGFRGTATAPRRRFPAPRAAPLLLVKISLCPSRRFSGADAPPEAKRRHGPRRGSRRLILPPPSGLSTSSLLDVSLGSLILGK